MEITVYDDQHGNPKVQIKEDKASIPEDTARAYKAVKKELEKEES